jgi:hypothetical protein
MESKFYVPKARDVGLSRGGEDVFVWRKWHFPTVPIPPINTAFWIAQIEANYERDVLSSKTIGFVDDRIQQPRHAPCGRKYDWVNILEAHLAFQAKVTPVVTYKYLLAADVPNIAHSYVMVYVDGFIKGRGEGETPERAKQNGAYEAIKVVDLRECHFFDGQIPFWCRHVPLLD